MRILLIKILFLSILTIGCEQRQKTSNSEITINSDSNQDLSMLTDSENSGSDTNEKTSNCHLPKDDPAHFDPFYNGHLHENFDPNQVDFSSEFYELRNKFFSNLSDQIDSLSNYDFSKIWVRKRSQIGVIGANYRKITIRIHSATRNNQNPLKYELVGESKVGDNLCDFSGTIELTNGYLLKQTELENITQGVIYGKYEFLEDPSQNHVGTFSGVIESSFLIDHKDNVVRLDTLSEVADGYNNNNFVGIWMEYNSNSPKKCIWGEYRLPFTFDFDIGDGEMYVNEKYRKYGWE